MHNNLDVALSPAPGSLRERDNEYYQLLAGGAKTRLLEGFLDLGVPELLGRRGPLTAGEICRELKLQHQRGWKFLHLLAMVGLVDQIGGQRGEDEAKFELSRRARQFFGDNG